MSQDVPSPEEYAKFGKDAPKRSYFTGRLTTYTTNDFGQSYRNLATRVRTNYKETVDLIKQIPLLNAIIGLIKGEDVNY